MKLRLVPVKFALWAICLFPGTEILAERGGVLFYVSFDGNGTAVGTDHVSPDVRCGNGKLNFQAGKRGKALRSGDGLGLPYYSPRGHVYPQQGSVEFWVCPLDWTPGDEKFHSFFQIQSPGFINIYKYHQSQQLLFRMGALYTDEKKVKVAAADVSNWKPGQWYHVTVTWDSKAQSLYLDGKPANRVGDPFLPKGLAAPMQVGDFALGLKRNTHSLLDELYIYDRALTAEEVAWAYNHALARNPGEDLPVDKFPQAKSAKLPRPSPVPVATPPRSASTTRPQIKYKYERGGVLFYAGFDKGKDADYAAGGNNKSMPHDGGGSLTASGIGKQDRALRTGDGEGYLEFAAEGNILPDSGSVEFWMMPENWAHDDKQQHIFFHARGNGGIRFREMPQGVQEWLIASDRSEPRDYDDFTPTLTSRAYGSDLRKGKWVHYLLTWEKDGPQGLYIGGFDASGFGRSAKCVYPGKLTSILIGDFGGSPDRKARTFLDEVYIYDRRLTYEEVKWAFKHSADRRPGMDIPKNFMAPSVRVVPRPKKKELLVKVDTGRRTADFSGTAHLEPAAGTGSAEVRPVGERFGEAIIPFKELSPGDYKVVVSLKDGKGKDLGKVSAAVMVPPKPVWLGNKIGISEVPPLPWPPIKGSKRSIRCWGRRYDIGSLGLPRQIHSLGKAILAGPVEFRIIKNGEVMSWEKLRTSMVKKNKVEVKLASSANSRVGKLSASVTAEYDGLIRYDLLLTPNEAVPVDGIELRFPILEPYATLYYMFYYSHGRGALPAGSGIIKKWGWEYGWWIGNEDVGLYAFTETDEAVQPRNPNQTGEVEPRQYGFRIERDQGAVTAIWSFALAKKPRILKDPWKFTFGLQATPVKDPRSNRRWHRMGWFQPTSHFDDIAGPNPGYTRYFSPPEPIEPDSYRNWVKNFHRRGKVFLPYFTLTRLDDNVPEFQWWQEEWGTDFVHRMSRYFQTNFTGCRPTPEFADYIVWKNEQLNREYDMDGIYIDWGTVQRHAKSSLGFGYVRNGMERGSFPFFAVREIFKRVYTMLKAQRPDKVMIAHTSGAMNPALMAFTDIYMAGEGDWAGQLRDNYLDVVPLDQFRAMLGRQYGAIPWWLPQWRNAVLDKKDVSKYYVDGKPLLVTPDKTHHLLGLGLLHDFEFWPMGNGMNPEACKLFYKVLEDFGYRDAEFIGYWKSGDLIGGQSEAIKASIYRKPRGGAFICIYNVTRRPQTPTLTVVWKRLKGPGELKVVDAFSRELLRVDGHAITIPVPPLNYRLLWVSGR